VARLCGKLETALKRRISGGFAGQCHIPGVLAVIQCKRILISGQRQQVVVVPTGFEAFSVDDALGSLVLFGQIEGDAVEHGKVLCCVARAFAADPVTDDPRPS